MAQERYFGEYVKFDVISANGADFLGADNLVGDAYSIELHDEGDSYKAVLVNRFGKSVAYLENRAVRRVQLAQAKEWQTLAYLSYFAFTQAKKAGEPGTYWGEVALIAYDPKLEPVMEPFLKKLSSKMADGARPQVDFGEKAVDQLVQSKGEWFPTDTAKRPSMGKGSEIIKDHRTPNERLIEQSRKGNIGCYILSYAFIGVLLALVVYVIHLLGVF